MGRGVVAEVGAFMAQGGGAHTMNMQPLTLVSQISSLLGLPGAPCSRRSPNMRLNFAADDVSTWGGGTV
jgi:hypothetical protein